MLGRLRKHATFANVGVIVALVLAGSGFAVAAIPGRDGVIHGCFNKRTGGLRVIDTGKHCTRRERALNWNQKGKPGATGAAGKQGQPGSDAQFNGAAAGGDLTGSYPNPAIRSGTINGTHVAPNSLTGVSIDESTLGQVPDAASVGGISSFELARRSRVGGKGNCGGSFITAPPGPGLKLQVSCVTSPSTGTTASITNQTGGPIDVLIADTSGATTTNSFDQLANNATATAGIDPSTDTVRVVTFQVSGGGGSPTITAVMTRRASGSLPYRAAIQSVF